VQGGCPTPEPPKILFVVLNNRITENCVLTRVLSIRSICGKYYDRSKSFSKI
jgi:hypothetical protein